MGKQLVAGTALDQLIRHSYSIIMDDLCSENDSDPWKRDEFQCYKQSSVGTVPEDSDKTVSAHACLFSESSACLFNHIYMRYAVMMQHRFDGMLGFPGGLVNPGENLTEGLNRELHEEIGLEARDFLSDSDYFKTWENDSHISHIYVKQFTEDRLKNMERNALNS